MYSKLYNPVRNSLLVEEKQKLIRDLLPTLKVKFSFAGIESFSLNDVVTEIVMLWHEGRKFVFVPNYSLSSVYYYYRRVFIISYTEDKE